jgi:hypothetical protein
MAISGPAGTPYTPEHLLGTVLHTLFDPGELRITPEALPATVTRMVNEGKPIKELFS